MALDARAEKSAREELYRRGVFINCPFDAAYRPMFDAIIFTVLVGGSVPRSALEIEDSSRARIEKIQSIIGDCMFGIHDISRVELNDHGLPRFNMPLELGLFLGAKTWGGGRQRQKVCLILDSDPYRYRNFISDISGQDITAHGSNPFKLISAVRNWLTASLAAGSALLPGGTTIAGRYEKFSAELPELCREAMMDIDEVTFIDKLRLMTKWLERNSGPRDYT